MADLEAFRARTPSELPPAPAPGRMKKRRVAAQPFLRGPIPLAWMARAQKAGGSALAVGLALWFVRGVSGEPGPVKVTASVRRRFGLSRDQTGYGLRALEAAGLVAYVKKGRGRCAVVEIVGAENPGGGTAMKPNGRGLRISGASPDLNRSVTLRARVAEIGKPYPGVGFAGSCQQPQDPTPTSHAKTRSRVGVFPSRPQS